MPVMIIVASICQLLLEKLYKLLLHIADGVLPDSQCGLKIVGVLLIGYFQLDSCKRNVSNKIWTYIRKVCDSVNSVALWNILKNRGCPEKFMRMLRQFHDRMEMSVIVRLRLSDSIYVRNGVKQGDTPSLALFPMYFAIVFQITFEDCTEGVYIRYKTTGKLLNLK